MAGGGGRGDWYAGRAARVGPERRTRAISATFRPRVAYGAARAPHGTARAVRPRSPAVPKPIFELTGDFELVSDPIVFVSMRSIRNWYQIQRAPSNYPMLSRARCA